MVIPENKRQNEPNKASERMPVLFIGHGSPMNAIEDNPWSKEWGEWGKNLPAPRAILCISAHWETHGSGVTAMEQPRTIHDFGGFPPELYAVQYPAPGSPWLASRVQSIVHHARVEPDQGWGLDHGCWSVLHVMYPQANIPVVQLSLNHDAPAQYHYDLAKELAPLREEGVLILASGNMVHNLRRVVFRNGTVEDFNVPYGLDWAIEANDLFKKLILENQHQALIDYRKLGNAVQMAIPTPEHYLPMLYSLALKGENESVTFFNDVALAGSLTMTSMIIQ